MKPLKKEDISQEVFDLYDDYAHNKIDRKRMTKSHQKINKNQCRTTI